MPPRQDPSIEVVNDMRPSENGDVDAIPAADAAPPLTSPEGKPEPEQPLLLRMLPLLLGLDMLAVSFVVPLLVQYYQDAGIRTAHQREWLSSLFSASQIVGGLVLGVVTDTWHISPTTILQITFLGSAVSYALLAWGTSVVPIVASRVVVGLVKHSMTVSTALVTTSTSKSTASRTQHMARLTASMTVVWIVGPSVGAILYRQVHPKAPAMVATGLFLLNFGLVVALRQRQDDGASKPCPSVERESKNATSSTAAASTDESSSEKKRSQSSAWSNLHTILHSRSLLLAVLVKLLATFCIRATSYHQLPNYYETMYGIETYHRGFVRSWEQSLSFLVQTLVVQRALQWWGGARRAIVVCAVLTTGGLLLEATAPHITLFLAVVCPLQALAQGVLQVSLQVLVSDVTPAGLVFSVLAALDLLQNVVSVSSPFYRTLLFDTLQRHGYATAQHPEPTAWLYLAALHWSVVAFVTGYLLLVAWRPVPTKTTKPKEA